MTDLIYSNNLNLLHDGEEKLRARSIRLVSDNQALLLHMAVAESAMDMLDMFRQMPTEDDDLKVVKMLGLRTFNALASSIKLMMSGYYQNSAMNMRDILETVFLVDLFRTDRSLISKWRHADDKTLRKTFGPVVVRKALDDRDGFNERKRKKMYRMFCELAAHPTMKGFAMLRPKGMDAHGGPFLDPTALEASVSELGRLAIQAGDIFNPFFPAPYQKANQALEEFQRLKTRWIKELYSD